MKDMDRDVGKNETAKEAKAPATLRSVFLRQTEAPLMVPAVQETRLKGLSARTAGSSAR